MKCNDHIAMGKRTDRKPQNKSRYAKRIRLRDELVS